MIEQEHPKRKYNSNRRQEQARETKQRILDAALTLFTRHGYAGATIEAIAQEAGVSPLTIFAAFGNKVTLLSQLVRVSVGGDDQPIPLLQRPGPQAVLQEMDPIQKILRFARDISDILERVAPLFEIMRMAAKTEPEIADLLSSRLEARFQNLSVFVSSLSAHSKLREGVGEWSAGETVWAIAGPDIYRLLTLDRGWSKKQYSQWLGDALIRLLLPGDLGAHSGRDNADDEGVVK